MSMCEGIFCLCVIREPLRVSVRGREKVIGEILCVCVLREPLSVCVRE